MYQICLAVVSRIINKYVRAKHSQAKQPHSRSGTTTTTTTSRRSRSTWKITSVTGKLMSRTKQLAHSASTDRFVNSHAHSHKHTRSLSLAFVIILALPHTNTHARAHSQSQSGSALLTVFALLGRSRAKHTIVVKWERLCESSTSMI